MNGLTNDEVKTKLSIIVDNVVNTSIKYCIVIWICLYTGINLPLIKNIVENVGEASFFFYLAVFLSALVVSSILIWKMRSSFKADKITYLWLLVSIFLLYKANEAYNWRTALVCMLIPLLLGVIIKYQKFFWIIPIICLAMDFIFPGFITTFLLFYIAIFFFKPDNREILKQNKGKVIIAVTALVFLFGIFRNYFNSGVYIDDSMIFQFYNDYFHFGFCTRGLMSTIIYLIFGYTRTWFEIKWFLFITHVLSLIGIFIFLLLIYNSVSAKYKEDCFTIMLAIWGSGAVRFMCLGDRDMLYFDSVIILITIACIYWVIKSKLTYLIPFMCAAAMCIHHIFGILLFPFLFVVMCYKCIFRKNIADILVLIFTTITVVGLFGYFQFFACKLIPISAEEGMQYFKNVIPVDSFSDILYTNINYVVFNGKVDSYGVQFRMFEMGDLLILASSVINILFLVCPEMVIIKSFFRSTNRKLYSCLPFALLVPLVSYMEVDYYRWDVAIALLTPLVLISMIVINSNNNWITDFKSQNSKNRFIGYLFSVMILISANV